MARQLIEAIRNGDQSLARNILLNDRYGCIDCQTAKRDGTALFWACAKGFVELVQLLIAKGANVNARTNYNSTPLIAAADSNRHHVVRLLIEHGADLNAQTSNGDTACHQAAYRGHMEAVQLLVANGADVDVANTKFRTPYDEAARQGHLNLLPFLDGQSGGARKLGRRPSLQTCGGPVAVCSRTRGTPASHPQTRLLRLSVPRESVQESSYEDCGQAAAVFLNAYDISDRLRARELDFEPEKFFPSSPQSLTPTHHQHLSGLSFPSATTFSSFPSSAHLSFTAGADVSFTSSSLPFTYTDVETNDLSLTSDRPSSKKNVISRLNIPA